MADSTICRLCLEQAEDLLQIFYEEDGVLKLNDVLSLYSIIELKPDDGISNKICSNCWGKINDFHEFCLRVQKIQDSIRSVVYVNNRSDINEIGLTSGCEDDDDAMPCEEITLIEVKTEGDRFRVVYETTHEDGKEAEQIKRENSPQGKLEYPKPDNEDTVPSKIEEKFADRRKRARSKATDDEESNDDLIRSFFELKCELCDVAFTSCPNLFDHYKAEHKIRGFIMCCGKKRFKITKIAEHVLWHKKPELFRCNKCDLDKVFPDRKHLEDHMVTHIDSSSSVFECEDCDKKFVKKSRYDQHKLSHLRPEEKKYICQDCGKPYATESLLRVHERVVHIKSYAHMCEICAKFFKSRTFFEKHQLEEHMGQSLPRVQCQICGVWMKNEHTMRAHMRLHDDAGAEHKCDICGKTGPSRNSILKHKRYVHTIERKFKCTLCEKAFKRAVSLKEHMTLHTGEVLYKCTFCPKTFNSKANMFAHKKKKHFEEWKMEKETNAK